MRRLRSEITERANDADTRAHKVEKEKKAEKTGTAAGRTVRRLLAGKRGFNTDNPDGSGNTERAG